MTTAIQTSPDFNTLNIQQLKTKLLELKPQNSASSANNKIDLWRLWSKQRQQLFKTLWQAIQSKSVQQLSGLQSLFIKANITFPDAFIWGESATFKECSIGEALKEKLEVDWLIEVFNHTFANYNTKLERSEGEPEYFAATTDPNTGSILPARITFAHGYFSSALHEASHWCIAGAHRRSLDDFGYWYAPDGRNSEQQQAFEQVEIKPQALECLFTRMCSKTFHVSQDNLNADFDTSDSTFAVDVYRQAAHYIADPNTLPKDAKTLLTLLSVLCQD